MIIHEIISAIEDYAPLSYQESYDNSGLIVGDVNNTVDSVLLTIDVTPEVMDEAQRKGAGLILSHHPVVFEGLKSLTGKNSVEKILIDAVKKDIAIYAAHTNMDNIRYGVNHKICTRLNLSNMHILRPLKGCLYKLVTFVPRAHTDRVRKALFNAGAGHIGKYDNCSFTMQGTGTFKGGEESHPFVGEKGKLHFEEEERVETVVPKEKLKQVISEMIKAHPYEEVAYDIYPLENAYENAGSGMIGELLKESAEEDFFNEIKKIFRIPYIRHSRFLHKKIKKVAVCGGSGSFLLRDAIAQKADIFISSDFKYHQFFDAEDTIVIADIGHFESEQFTKELFYDILNKKFPKFAIHFSDVNTNPINYF